MFCLGRCLRRPHVVESPSSVSYVVVDIHPWLPSSPVSVAGLSPGYGTRPESASSSGGACRKWPGHREAAVDSRGT
jgi:hypothetical protein